MTTTIEFPAIDTTKISRVYSGKPGCMCGCKGKYTEFEHGGKNVGSTRIMNTMKDACEKGFAEELEVTEQYVFVSTATRYYAIYMKD